MADYVKVGVTFGAERAVVWDRSTGEVFRYVVEANALEKWLVRRVKRTWGWELETLEDRNIVIDGLGPLDRPDAR